MLVLLLLAGLGVLLVLVSFFFYGERNLRLVAEAEQYLAEREPAAEPVSALALPASVPVMATGTDAVLDSASTSAAVEESEL